MEHILIKIESSLEKRFNLKKKSSNKRYKRRKLNLDKEISLDIKDFFFVVRLKKITLGFFWIFWPISRFWSTLPGGSSVHLHLSPPSIARLKKGGWWGSESDQPKLRPPWQKVCLFGIYFVWQYSTICHLYFGNRKDAFVLVI